MRRGGHTLARCEVGRVDIQPRSREHRKRDTSATSKVRPAIMIPHLSPRGMSLPSCAWFSELSRLSNWENMAWTANSLVRGMTAQYSKHNRADLQIINGWIADPLRSSGRPPRA